LELNFVKLLSNAAFKFNSRHYSMVDPAGGAREAWEAAQGFPQRGEEMSWDVVTAGSYTRSLLSSS
jgi:hypothetical protein